MRVGKAKSGKRPWIPPTPAKRRQLGNDYWKPLHDRILAMSTGEWCIVTLDTDAGETIEKLRDHLYHWSRRRVEIEITTNIHKRGAVVSRWS